MTFGKDVIRSQNIDIDTVKQSFIWGATFYEAINPDEITSPGLYHTDNIQGIPYDNGFFLVLSMNSGNRVIQINTNYGTETKIRSRWHERWYPWKTISLS